MIKGLVDKLYTSASISYIVSEAYGYKINLN